MSGPAARPAVSQMFYKDSHKAWFVRIGGNHVRLADDEEAARRRYGEVMADPAAAVSAGQWAPRPTPPPPAPAPKPRAVAARPADTAPAKPPGEPSGTNAAFKVNLVNHRVVAKAFGVSIGVLMRGVRRGEFVTPHSVLGRFYLFDRATIEHRLATGTWPRGAKFRGSVPDDGDA